jgi:DNA-binding NarL/FixJ family response regulator
MMKIKLILADDHPLIRAGFRALLAKCEDFEIVGEASDGKELLSEIESVDADVVLVDITMPKVNGLAVIEQLKKKYSNLRIIILTMHEEAEYVLHAVRLGADGYLLKNIDSSELEKAIKTVYSGGKYFSQTVAGILAESTRKPQPERYEVTPREKEVLALVATGNSTKQIAAVLDISIRTVETHRINLLKKLNVSNSAELIRKALELKLIG